MPAFLYQNTGNIPTAKDSIPKILWLKEERKQIWDRTAYLLDCKEYILFKLTGRIAIDWVGASVYFLFNPHTKKWSEEVCQELGIPLEKLPPAFPCTEVIGEITPQAAQADRARPGDTGGDLCRGCGRGTDRCRRQRGWQGPPVHRDSHLDRHFDLHFSQ